MNKFGWKFALIGAATLVGLLAIWPPKERLKTGIDLSGGTILVYEVKRDASTANVDLDELILSLKKRVNPDGVLDIPIRKIGQNRIEIILPKANAEAVEEVKRKLTNVGSLEFRILATRYKKKSEELRAIDRALKEGSKSTPNRFTWAKLSETFSGVNPVLSSDKKQLTDNSRRWVKNSLAGRSVFVTGKTAAGTDQSASYPIDGNSENSLKLGQTCTVPVLTSYRIDFNPSNIVEGDPNRPDSPIIREETVGPGHTEKWILCELDREGVTGQYLSRVYEMQDDHFQPAVGFRFDRTGARKFSSLTGRHLPQEEGNFKYQLAILLDGVVQSAPSINAQISDTGMIEFGRSGRSIGAVSELISILQAGKLPASLNPEPLQEESVGPTLGEDTIAKGILAIEISMLVVPLFMIVYYRFAGVVAVVALILNMILLLGSMAIFEASFTLPGLAGLALTIGMAVDANVLIFERMREEQDRGANLSQQIRNGFSRAWVTIFDANVTTMLSGMVLYLVGTDEVKGFALTLIIGLIWNLFTAVYVSRVIFDFWHYKGWLRQPKFLKIMDKTNIDFIGPRKICLRVSLVIIIIGLVAFFSQGQKMFNIDFTGGTLVTIRLNQDDAAVKSLTPLQRTNFVRDKVAVLPDASVESLSLAGDSSATRYNIRTTIQSKDAVRDELIKAFGTALQRVQMNVGEPKPIAVATPSATTPTDPAPKAASATERFPGGRVYDLTFNLPQSAGAISSILRNVLTEAGIKNAESRYEIINPRAGIEGGTAPDSTVLTMRTDLEPDLTKAQLIRLGTLASQDNSLLFERSETFGSTVAGETRNLAIVATIASWIIITAFLWLRFKSLTYGLAAIVAVIHDVLITLGAVAASHFLAPIPIIGPALMLDQFKIDLPMIAAFLTLIGFSVNDTIVIFDRIREIKGKTPYLTAKMINDAVNQTLSRTILTSFTAWLVVIILYIFGGEGLHGFAFSLVVGFLSGTYSTIYIASPILIDWIGRTEAPGKATNKGKYAGVNS